MTQTDHSGQPSLTEFRAQLLAEQQAKQRRPIGLSSDPAHAAAMRTAIAALADDKLALVLQLALAAVSDVNFLPDVSDQVDRTEDELLGMLDTDLLPLASLAHRTRGWCDHVD